MIAYPVQQDVPYQVSVFLRTKPKVFAVLEMLVSLVMIVFIITYKIIWFIVFPLIYILTGSVIVLAASKHNVCLVKTSHALSYINIITIAISIFFHWTIASIGGIPGIVFIVGDVLILIFSIVIASAFCSCCWRPRSRSVAVRYVSSTVPVNNFGLFNHSVLPASSQPVSSVMYMLPAAYSQVPYSAPPNHSMGTPAQSYLSVPTAAPAYYSSVPCAPPSDYDQPPAFAPPELRTQEQVNQIHQYMK